MIQFKKLIILSLILAFCLSVSNLEAQDYKMYAYYNSLSSYQESEDSTKYYRDKAMSFVDKPILNDRFYWLKRYAEEGNETKLMEHYKFLLQKGYTYEDVFVDSYRKIKAPDDMIEKLKLTKVIQDIDIDFAVDYSQYLGGDQFVRRRFFKDRDCMEKYMYEIDSLNHTRLKEYIDKNGYPNATQLGKYKFIPQLLITHIITNESTKSSWYGYYRPLLMEQAKIGEISYGFIASLDDRFHECYDDYQLYGIWYMAEKSTYGMTSDERKKVPKKLTTPIKDIENLDKRRAEMGMPPFYMQANNQNIELPEGYKPNK